MNSLLIRDNRNKQYSIASNDKFDVFKQTIIDLLEKRNKPESFKYVLIAIQTTSNVIEIAKTHLALDPETGTAKEIGFGGTFTKKDASRRFGDKIVPFKSHQYPSDTDIFQHVNYCLVSQRTDGQYYLLT